MPAHGADRNWATAMLGDQVASTKGIDGFGALNPFGYLHCQLGVGALQQILSILRGLVLD
jgi:hypothetical protein